MADANTSTCIDILLAIILPPLGVLLRYGCKVEFWICLVLTFFGYIPGIIYAVYAITVIFITFCGAMNQFSKDDGYACFSTPILILMF